MKISIKYKTADQQMIFQWLPMRKRETHKGNYGKILMICGSEGFTGAPALAAMAAERSGAGLVFVGVPQSVYPIIATKLDEPIVFPLPEKNGKLSAEAIPEIIQRLSKCDVCLVGCGLGLSFDTKMVVRAILENATCPVILDADAITIVGKETELVRNAKVPIILTPHEGEFARLGADLKRDGRLVAVKKMSRNLNCTILLKGYRTLICGKEGIWMNRTGNPGMATGGSGDVLVGIIASLVGQGLSPQKAAVAGAWLHGMAGDYCAATIGEYGMLPTDMISVLPKFLL